MSLVERLKAELFKINHSHQATPAHDLLDEAADRIEEQDEQLAAAMERESCLERTIAALEKENEKLIFRLSSVKSTSMNDVDFDPRSYPK